MAKLPDWQTALDRYIAESLDRPFSYDWERGLDCCRFTFGAIQAQTGRPIGAQFEGAYRNRKEALLAMMKYAGSPVLAAFVEKLMGECGYERLVSPLYAQRGDAVLCPNGHGMDKFFGCLDLNGRDVISVGEDGLKRVPISILCRAWRIA